MSQVSEHVKEMSYHLKRASDAMLRYSEKIDSDIEYCSEVASEITNLIIALQLNVFMARIIRQKENPA